MNVHEMWSDEELDRALGALNAEVPPGDKSLTTARADLMAAAGPPEALRPKATRHWGRWVAAVAVVGALTTSLLVAPFGDEPQSADAAAVLNNAADKIGSSDPVVKPGQYLYIEKRSSALSFASESPTKTISYRTENLTQTWVPADRGGEWLRRTAEVAPRKVVVGTGEDMKSTDSDTVTPPSEERAKCGDFWVEPGETVCHTKPDYQNPKPEFLNSLPTDPRRLYEWIRTETDGRSGHPDLAVVVYVVELVRSGLVPAAVRANLYRALAMVPGLEVSDRNANLAGRVGIGLGVDRAGRKHELIIDPVTGQFIGERETVTKAYPTLPLGALWHYSSVTTGVVDKMGDKPGQ